MQKVNKRKLKSSPQRSLWVVKVQKATGRLHGIGAEPQEKNSGTAFYARDPRASARLITANHVLQKMNLASNSDLTYYALRNELID